MTVEFVKLTPELLRARKTQIRINEQHGGLAIPSAADLHPCAYLASYLLHLRKKPAPLAGADPPICMYRGKMVFDGPRYAERAALHIHRNSYGLMDAVLPLDPHRLFDKYRRIGEPARASKHEFGRHLQRAFAKAMHLKQWNDMCARSNALPGAIKRAARFYTLLMERAGRWLSAPLDEDNHLSDDEFSVRVRLRLGLPLVNDMPDRCPLCQKDSSAPLNSDHLLYCRQTEKMFIDRHDDVVQTLKRIANQFARAKAEPPADHRALRDTRPDLVIRHPHGTYFTDVRIVHTCAPSYAAKKPEAVMRSLRRDKARKHKEYVDLQAGEIHPFIVSTFGSMDDSCSEFFNLIRRFAANSNPSDPTVGPAAVGSARSAVAVAIQRAVAHGIMDALFAARISERRERPPGGWR